MKQIKADAAKPDGLSWLLTIHMGEEGADSCKLSCDHHTSAMAIYIIEEENMVVVVGTRTELRLSGKHLYSLSNLASPCFGF